MASSVVVVIGGGIAATTCLQTLIQNYFPSKPAYTRIVLISQSRLVKTIANYATSGRNLESFDVRQADAESLLAGDLPQGLQVSVIVAAVHYIDPANKLVAYGPARPTCSTNSKADPATDNNQLSGQQTVGYHLLCVCCGARPRELSAKLPSPAHEALLRDKLITIRDTTTIESLKAKLAQSKRVVIVGNGGIGLELVYKISNCDKIWIIRDKSIGCKFFDPGAAKFLLEAQANPRTNSKSNSRPKNRPHISSTNQAHNNLHNTAQGPALGPHWLSNGDQLVGQQAEDGSGLEIVYDDELLNITPTSSGNMTHPLSVRTRAGRQFECDLLLMAVGVVPNQISVVGTSLQLSQRDGGILVDTEMRTSVPNIYAAGDVVSCERWPANDLWFQMRLWTQARQMGYYAARCMIAHSVREDPAIYFNFDCFTHCTSFFGFNLVLLGRYNAQAIRPGQEKHYEVLARVNPAKEYVKVILRKNKIVGAVLVGDSGLEETIENLIHDRIDVAAYKDRLLDGSVDIEDYFD